MYNNGRWGFSEKLGAVVLRTFGVQVLLAGFITYF